MKEQPKVGTIVKLHVMLNDGIRLALGRVARVYDGTAFIDCNGRQYSRYWDGLTEATQEEEVLWRLEQ